MEGKSGCQNPSCGPGSRSGTRGKCARVQFPRACPAAIPLVFLPPSESRAAGKGPARCSPCQDTGELLPVSVPPLPDTSDAHRLFHSVLPSPAVDSTDIWNTQPIWIQEGNNPHSPTSLGIETLRAPVRPRLACRGGCPGSEEEVPVSMCTDKHGRPDQSLGRWRLPAHPLFTPQSPVLEGH